MMPILLLALLNSAAGVVDHCNSYRIAADSLLQSYGRGSGSDISPGLRAGYRFEDWWMSNLEDSTRILLHLNERANAGLVIPENALLWVAGKCPRGDGKLCSIALRSKNVLVRAAAGDSSAIDSVIAKGSFRELMSIQNDESWTALQIRLNDPGLSLGKFCEAVVDLWKFTNQSKYRSHWSEMSINLSGMSGWVPADEECQVITFKQYLEVALSESKVHIAIPDRLSACYHPWKEGK